MTWAPLNNLSRPNTSVGSGEAVRRTDLPASWQRGRPLGATKGFGGGGGGGGAAVACAETAFGHYLNFIRRAESRREEAVKKFKFCFTFHTFGYDKMDGVAAAAAAAATAAAAPRRSGDRDNLSQRSVSISKPRNLTGKFNRRIPRRSPSSP